jgi:hypothetical protein
MLVHWHKAVSIGSTKKCGEEITTFYCKGTRNQANKAEESWNGTENVITSNDA